MIHTFENEKQLNIFNPKYKYHIYEDLVDLKFDKISKFILQLEKNLSHIDSRNLDGGTGLGDKSLTSKHSFYNLLSFEEMKEIKYVIKKHNKKFLSLLKTKYDNFYIKCWANVMRDSEKINVHCHNTGVHGYLVGHICILTKDTNTYYINPYTKKSFASKNKNGKLTLFPAWLDHYTDKVSNDLRITVAFDIITEHTWYNDIADNMKKHWISL
tara:strand:- start:176 stop:814 length:639 start_codon:yes stop_codon:yes gene_type:complete